ncbi:acyl carrier protein [Campylobacter peloridis]|uniref:acyl carrier protein n=1 Tax=Campylobacter peloridis TaxID=488546 RepID=UPI001C737440|nr:phosphopantetheine-binding protein [Campylobacter peloridis]MBX2078147.1 acyl carrier protein [Campylobacter peloridis]MCV3431919.1 phosphopantetheine-binding protein [Campylobacter lari]HEC1758239.1 acyl carrier protein [Campylobacter lari]
MTKEKFLEHLEDALQLDYKLSIDTNLEDIEEYDSLGLISVIALYNHLFNINIPGKTLRECKNINDLIALIPSEHLES